MDTIKLNYVNYLLIFSFLISRIIDLFTTFIGISKGLNEINPFMRSLLENNLIDLIFILNIVLIFSLLISNYFLTNIKDIYLKRVWVKSFLFLLIILNIIGFFTILNNLYQHILIDGVIQI